MRFSCVICFFLALVGRNVPAPVALFSAKKCCHMKPIQSTKCIKTTGPEPVKDECRTGFQVVFDEMYGEFRPFRRRVVSCVGGPLGPAIIA